MIGGALDYFFSYDVARVTCTLVIIALSWALWKIRPLYVPSTVPGPRRFPLIGYLWYPLRHWHRWPDASTECCQKYEWRTWGGPLLNWGGLPGAYFYISDPQNIQHILSDSFDTYGKGDMWTKVLGELLGNGIFAVDGQTWRHHRKVMSNMFSRNLLRHTATVTKSKLFEVVQLFEDRLTDGNSEFEIDIQDIFFRLTMDVTSKVTFGVDLNGIANKEQHHFAKSFDELSALCQLRFLDPFFELKKWLQLSRPERRIRQLKKIVDDYAMGVIQSNRRSADEGSSLGPDLLSRFQDHAHKNQEPISDNELRDIVMNIILAGRDTTACALSWTWFELTKNPHVVDEIIKEVEAICGSGDNADVSYDSMSKLRYTDAVIMEVLRLHPPVTNDPRYATGGTDDMLPDGTNIPAGSGIDLCFYAMGRSEKIWGSDVLDFKPGRFLDAKEPSAFKYPVFNAGPRMCIGKPLAMMNIKLVMSVLLPRFHFVDKRKHSGAYKWSLVQSMKDGFPVTVSAQTG